ncbi:universal stress protein [Sphaerisporangium rubeum]|uniref:Nucleotide-binding universal stress UspA family protein n=1 Tax=Sphaerisporangium rubeum TaxID=321317 RepID=A0A7X0M6E8_9ACTN|nr:nucleotide-binding universal stress UspA family protein [Sphaerisporangium rubeum]
MAAQIVVGVNGSASDAAAVDWAADDAARRDAHLKIVHVHEPWSYEFPLKPAPGSRDSHTSYWRSALAAAAKRVRTRTPGTDVSVALITGAVTERLTTESEHADELVLGGEGRGGLAALLLGSVGRAVTCRAHAPVVVVRRPRATAHDRVVVGFDGSPASEAALAYAADQALRRGASLRVIHVRSPLRRASAPQVAETLRERLEAWRAAHPGLRITARSLRGHPALTLIQASHHGDLLVIGTHTKTGHAHLGSVAHHVLHRSDCPVAVIHPGHGPGTAGGGEPGQA